MQLATMQDRTRLSEKAARKQGRRLQSGGQGDNQNSMSKGCRISRGSDRGTKREPITAGAETANKVLIISSRATIDAD